MKRYSSTKATANHLDWQSRKITELQEKIRKNESKICKWEQNDNGDWDAQCGESLLFMFVLIGGTPEENGFNFCPFCGAALEEEK